MNITKLSNSLVDAGNHYQSLGQQKIKKNNYVFLVLLPYLAIVSISVLTVVVALNYGQNIKNIIFFVSLFVAWLVCFVLIHTGYSILVKSEDMYNFMFSQKQILDENMSNQSKNLKSFNQAVINYLDLLGLYVATKNSNFNNEINYCLEKISKYNQQVVELSDILNSKSHSTDFNEIIQKVLLTRVKNTNELGINISATSEHPLFVDIDESSLYFVLLTLIDNVMAKSTQGTEIDFKAKKNKNIALIKIQSTNTRHELNSKKSNNLDSLNTELILTSEENIDMYMIKTVLDRYGGHLEFDSQSNLDITTMIIPLELKSNSDY